MKKVLSTLAALLAAVTLYAAPQKITFDKLPKNSQEFVQKYFAGETIRSVEMDRSSSSDKYVVWFDNGSSLTFAGGSGDCTQVMVEEGSIPYSLLKAPMKSYLQQHYPSERVVMWESMKEGSRLKLASGVVVYFDQDGKYVKATK